MKLGVFSISLSVKDIHHSKSFYENLGFKVFGGDINQKWLILKNDLCIIGLFQGMFEGNILTFNPGWDENANTLDTFTDVRALKKICLSHGIVIQAETGEGESGPGSFTIQDPDGNSILIDQHV